MGFEPTTPTLARLCSTPELHPHPKRGYAAKLLKLRTPLPRLLCQNRTAIATDLPAHPPAPRTPDFTKPPPPPVVRARKWGGGLGDGGPRPPPPPKNPPPAVSMGPGSSLRGAGDEGKDRCPPRQTTSSRFST